VINFQVLFALIGFSYCSNALKVLYFMLSESRIIRKHLFTNGTFKWLLSSMNTFMRLHSSLLGEGFCTEGTLKWLFPSVDAEVYSFVLVGRTCRSLEKRLCPVDMELDFSSLYSKQHKKKKITRILMIAKGRNKPSFCGGQTVLTAPYAS
jgi:hypothetical protein